MNAPANLFLNPTVTGQLGFSGILSGLPPTANYLGAAVNGFGVGINAVAPQFSGEWLGSAAEVQRLLGTAATPAQFLAAQRRLANVLEGMTGRQMLDVLEISQPNSLHRFATGDQFRADLEQALGIVDATAGHYLGELTALGSIPSISYRDRPSPTTYDSARWVSARLQQSGFTEVRLLEAEGANPSVFARMMVDPNAPTVLFYAHHDVQAADQPGWIQTDPFSFELREGRLYGRGAADDKAGALAFIAAIESYIRVYGSFPFNVAILVEGEEEISSPNLTKLLTQLQEQFPDFKPNVVVLGDTGNVHEDVPTITTSTRGGFRLIVEVQSVGDGSHSGMGSSAPDVFDDLDTVLRSVRGPHGELVVSGLTDSVPPPPSRLESDLDYLATAGFVTVDGLRDEFHMFPDSRFRVPGDPTVQNILRHTWRGYSMRRLRITGPQLDGGPLNGIVAPFAHAALEFRVPPGMDPRASAEMIAQVMRDSAPPGVRVNITLPPSATPPWQTSVDDPMFDTMREALALGYGGQAVFAGTGGGISFLQRFTDQFPGVVMIPIAVEDPRTKAHYANESLSINVFVRAARSTLAFLGLMSETR